MGLKQIRRALISVYHKDGLDEIVKRLHRLKVEIVSTGGTKSYIEDLGIPVIAVEELTNYPSILGGRVKTLHPKVFGGILSRRQNKDDQKQLEEFGIQNIDLVIVDLYPFEETVARSSGEEEIIEKIDIGGISLIRAAAKNYRDVALVSHRGQYAQLLSLLQGAEAETSLEERKMLAREAFRVSSAYDTAIFNYFDGGNADGRFQVHHHPGRVLRYGENPHQKGVFYGKLEALFDQLHGKEISYNNLLDIDAAVHLIQDFSEPTVAILKHNNACGAASRGSITEAWKEALAADPLSAFGGIIVCNRTVDRQAAEEMHKIFFEIVIAPAYEDQALEVLKQKKNRIILIQKPFALPDAQYRSLLNGLLWQEKDGVTETSDDLETVTEKAPSSREVADLLFANKLVKHSKSNSIVLVKNGRLIASGVGETSRVDALKHAIEKARFFKIELEGAVMASDAFFPFADSVEIAYQAGIKAVIQPGGSIRDKDSVTFCNEKGMAMVFTGKRHFKH